MIRVDIETNEPLLDMMAEVTPSGGGRIFYNGLPFTGIIYGYHPGTQILDFEWEVFDGYEEGRKVEYYLNGNKRVEYYVRNGGIYKFSKKWDEQGVLTYHVDYDEEGNKLRIVKHPNPALEE
ncbi:hypothetical protein LY01_00048 [Nonlabens xylanidelens]|uniref:MORN repeat protein n=1 Tax=Nonlabens xylanidelens TaxID=191564 RepID=A0A2S6IPP9_9FLAO|nr:hypothetical protein [Nonlabens xylanidelens]PPK96234.1 hypothetical protein LY01_00048 [Nonlabens xylanidelens]PQJ17972.1 hypothetical protein BST94_08110 [Nonlabens xylanidelens]